MFSGIFLKTYRKAVVLFYFSVIIFSFGKNVSGCGPTSSLKKDWSSNLLSCELFKVYENTFFQEYPVTLTLHICIVVEILCLTRDKVASLALVGHPSSDRLT